MQSSQTNCLAGADEAMSVLECTNIIHQRVDPDGDQLQVSLRVPPPPSGQVLDQDL
jgi:hypothetical protein